LSKEVTHYLWIDLETTGTNERLDDIVEVGFIITDRELVEIRSGSTVTQISERGWQRLKDTEVVFKMHTENGLIADLERLNEEIPTAGGYGKFIVNLLEDMGVEPHHVMLAGSGVSHFDRRFMREQMPWLEGYLAYPSLDVGILRRFWRDVCGLEVSGLDEGKTHRGLDDIRCHLEEARWFREKFKSL